MERSGENPDEIDSLVTVMSDLQSALRRADQYLAARGLSRMEELGFGKDGRVWSADRATAIKIHDRQHAPS
jgi:hypothetical protein